jgi:hypothetical protein
MCNEAGISPREVAAFSVTATPEAGKTPTRVNHQLVFASGGLESSINMSLTNPNVFAPAGKKGFSWGQLAVEEQFETWLGVTTNQPDGQTCEVEASFYNADGKIFEVKVPLPGGSARTFRVEELLPVAVLPGPGKSSDYVWYELRSDRPDIYGYSVNRHRVSGHCSGEHAF